MIYCPLCAQRCLKTKLTEEVLEEHINTIHEQYADVLVIDDKVYVSLRTPPEIFHCPIQECGKKEANREAWEHHIREVHHATLSGMPSGSSKPHQSPKCETQSMTPRTRVYPAKPANTSGSRTKQNFYIEVPPFSKPRSSSQFTTNPSLYRDESTLATNLNTTRHRSTFTPSQPISIFHASSYATSSALCESEQPTTSQRKVSKFTPAIRKRALQTSPTPLRGRPAKHPKMYRQSKHWEAARVVIVRIQDTEFQLNTSRLERLSGWFKDRLSNHDLQMIDLDGTKISSNDFEILLNALDKFSTFENKPPSFLEITAILRAATALRFEAEAAWAADRVQAMWSSQLVDVNFMHRPYAVETITAARQCDLNAVIKPAFYELIRSATTSEMLKEDIRNGRLTMEDLVMIESARQKLSVRWVALVSVHDSLQRFPHCGDDTKIPVGVPLPQRASGNGHVAQQIRNYEKRTTGEVTALRHSREQGAMVACISADAERLKQAHTKVVHESGILQRYIFDPVCGLQVLADAPWSKEGLCPTCVQARRAVWQAEREKLWAEMDGWFGVGASQT